MRESAPMAKATSSTSASVASQRAEILLMEEILCARKALATSFDNSEDQRLVVKIRSRGTHCAYRSTSTCTASRPSGVDSPPIRIRSGFSKSATAEPSARNSGFESTWWRIPLPLWARIVWINSAVRTGIVLFSTMILGRSAQREIVRATASTKRRSAARSIPSPKVLVGVLTLTKTTSALLTADSTSVVKNRFRPLAAFTKSSNPGS